VSEESTWATSSDRRGTRISETCELTIQVMNLRPPQAESLRRLAGLLQRLPRPLHACSPDERRSFLTDGDRWSHTAHPSFTLALATGVGKTRLAGAIMALLYLSKEARTFLVLAPRRAVLRRFSDALDPEFREYIFVEPGLVPEPNVITGDLIAGPEGVEVILDMFRTGPTIYLLSPQLITTSERFRGKQAFTGRSPLEHLRQKDDLVVLVDEAHHVGGLGKAEAARWTEAIRELAPAVQFGLTATPRGEAGENILYEYPLSRALAEQLYVKDVHLLVRNFEGALLSDEDVDEATIAYALDRLRSKEEAIESVSVPPFPSVKPVCVFFGRDISHAEWIASRLREVHGLSDDEILVTHSRSSKNEEQVERLLSIEELDNPVRVVVNVQELTEGWDVRNVYVVAPLRAMATFQGALQSMGRGLRLPSGRRVGHPEVDSLDVVCFGKQSMRDIVQEATTWLDKSDDAGAGGVIVNEFDAGARVVQTLDVVQRRSIGPFELHELEPIHEEVSLEIAPAAIAQSARMAVEELDLVKLRAKFAEQRLVEIPRPSFVNAAASRVLRVASKYLSDDVHYERIAAIVQGWLDASGVTGESVDFDPAQVGEELGRIIIHGAKRRALAYQSTGRCQPIEFGDFSESVVVQGHQGHSMVEMGADQIPVVSEGSFQPGMLVAGCDGANWVHSLHACYVFDSWPEVKVAWLFDHGAEVDWWVRNQPRRLRIRTPAGLFSPDFVALMKTGELLILEVKGSIYWEPEESEARTKARSAVLWAKAQTELLGAEISFGVALDSDAISASTLAALREMLLQG
jgi:superfamily II DNA or RNA helicase